MLIVAALVYLLLRGLRVGEEALVATEKSCEASERLTAWHFANPDLLICDSNYARALVEENIRTWREFLRTHPRCKDNGREAFLQSLLVPSPDPKTPKSQKPPQSSGGSTIVRGRFLF